MTRYFIAQISIEGFRGVNNEGDPLVIKFKPNAVNSIHAHNGVGKTSIFEAIHFAIFGTVPRLAKLQSAERPEQYVVNRFHPAQRSEVILWFEADDGSGFVEIAVTSSPSGSRVVSSNSGHANPEQFLHSLQEDFVLVDYAKFAEFVDSSALERGRSFASLVGLNRYSQLRQALQGACETRTLNADFEIPVLHSQKAGRERERAESATRVLAAYADITGQAVPDLSDVEGMCATITTALQSQEILKPVVGTNEVRQVDIAAAEKLVEKEEGGPLKARHGEVLKSLLDLNSLAPGATDATEQTEILRLASERDTAMARVGGSMLRSLYENANAVVTDRSWPDPKQCPVCDTKLDSSLADHLKERIAQYATADEANASLEVAINQAATIARLGSLEKALGLDTSATMHPALMLSASKHVLPTAELATAYARLDEHEAKRLEVIKTLDSERADIEKKLPPSLLAVSKMLAAIKSFCDALAAHTNATAAVTTIGEDLAVRQRWQKFIGKACESFSEAEAKLANERIRTIEAEYQALFIELVRGGPNVRPTLERATGTQNVDLILSDFHGLTNINARAVLSESYRNAVAGSIFLSAAMRYNGMPRFVILDDVTSSFDAGHQFSLMEAIRTKLQQPANPNGLQFIILSHDTALEKYFDKQNGTVDWCHQKLQGMPPMGRVMITTQEADRLKVQAQNLLNAGQVDLGSPFVRQYLEYKLGHIISKLEIPCPPDYTTRGDKRTLSTYLDAITNAIDLYHAAGRCVLTTAQMADIKNTHVPAIVGNFVSHYETGTGTPFGAYALLGVLQNIDALADCFKYTDNTQTPPVTKFCRRLDRQQ